MTELSGPISERLRAIFGPDVAEWPAWRESETIEDMPAVAYSGTELGDPSRLLVDA